MRTIQCSCMGKTTWDDSFFAICDPVNLHDAERERDFSDLLLQPLLQLVECIAPMRNLVL